jgi:prepilin-type N-terminal cleavage/methylation domain-containing protein
MHMLRGKGGVTLIELAVVMAIVAIMGLFLAPAIGEWLDNFRIRQAARDISSTLQVAKIKAISRRLEYRVVFNLGDEDTYHMEWKNAGSWDTDSEETAKTVPKSVDIDSASFNFGSNKAYFKPDGTSSNGTITIDNEQGKQYKVVVYYTGRIRIEECQP